MALIQPCKTSAVYEAIPERRVKLDMDAFETNLRTQGWDIVANGGIILVVKKGRDNASVFEDGKALIKTQEKSVAERVWNELSAHYVLKGTRRTAPL